MTNVQIYAGTVSIQYRDTTTYRYTAHPCKVTLHYDWSTGRQAATYCDGHMHLKQAVQGLQNKEGPLLITELQVTAHEEPDSSQLLQTEVPQRLPVRDNVTCMEPSPGNTFHIIHCSMPNKYIHT